MVQAGLCNAQSYATEPGINSAESTQRCDDWHNPKHVICVYGPDRKQGGEKFEV